MFRYRLSMGRVHDLIEVREGTESLVLRVDADPIDLVRMINRLEPSMNNIQNQEEPEKEVESIAREFCTAIFGKDQTGKLFELYNGDGASVFGIVSRYFSERLGKLITKAQKKAKV